MKVFSRDYKIEHYDSPLYKEYFGGMKPCVLDIEATGLDPSRCKVVLMGLLTETNDGLRVTQFLAENHYEENRVLEATLEFLRDEEIDYIITFNGLRYDVPFINTRLERLGFDDRLKIYDFDLYRFLRKCSVLPSKLDSLSQASVEKYFGIAKDRQDTISGRESVALFDEYAISGDTTVEKIILTHNREDVLQLYKLMKLAGYNDFENVLPQPDATTETNASTGASIGASTNASVEANNSNPFHTAIAKFGFPVMNGRLSARPILNKAKKELRISGDQMSDPIAAAYFPDIDRKTTAIFNAGTSSYEITIPVEEHNGTCYLDLNDYPELQSSLASDNQNIVNNFLILDIQVIRDITSIILKEYLKKS